MVVNESYKILAICESIGCPWRTYWRKKKSDGFTMRLSTFNNEHRCATDTDHKSRMADAVWVATVMLEHMKVSTYRMAYKGHIKPMEDPRDWPKPTLEQLYNPPLHTRGIGRPRKNIRRDEDEEAPNKKRRKCRLCRTEGHNSKTCKGLPAQPKGKSKAKDVESSQASNGLVPASPSQPNTRSKSKVASSSPVPASPSQPSIRSKSKVSTESQPPASPSLQPSTRSKSICASSNQVPTSPSSQPSTRSKSKATSSSQVPHSPSSQPSTRGKSKETTSSQPNTRAKTKEAASSQPISRAKSKETVVSQPASSHPSTRAKTKAACSTVTKPSTVNFQSPTPKQLQTLATGGVPLPKKPHKANTFQTPEQRHTFADLMKRLRDTYMPPRAAEKLNSSSSAPPKMAKATKQNKPPLAPPPNLASSQKFQTVRLDWKL
ncbi:hypothetical protein IFM89_013600 [Coptis chinensis]|uniref:Transposase MuDR plant domain-containing protein n=1 Tax=Coptis chinensis TaxID=261450 RepID=A0A835LME4_9MAGN|nr:hypothetical protein IFM89_013600 [Coptis chinensis]